MTSVLKRVTFTWHLIFLGTIISIFVYTRDLSSLLLNYGDYLEPWPQWADSELIETAETAADNLSRMGLACNLPKLKLFPEKLLKYLKQDPPGLDCATQNTNPIYFETSTDPVPSIVPVVSMETFARNKIAKCCIRYFQRYDDNEVDDAPDCYPISLEHPTEIPEKQEFWKIECSTRSGKTTIDILTTIPDKLHANNSGIRGGKFNVIVILVDACSRQSLIRTMPNLYKFLTKNMSAVDLEMYHKVGESTLPNILPLLANRHTSGKDRVGECEIDKNFDACPFIWKDFKQAGYLTLSAEDSESLPNFNWEKKGFIHKPTDFYLRPFTLTMGKILSYDKRLLSPFCFGPRPAFETVLTYIKQVMVSLERTKQPYFQFAFLGSLTHDLVNGGRLLEPGLLRWLQGLHTRKKYFENTILLIGSDHGSRVSSIAGHYQSFVEDRHPFMLISVPESFRVGFPREYDNLLENSKRLTTPWDVHQMLRHVLTLSGGNASADTVQNRQNGISLFENIPKSRSCEDALIPDLFCSCNLNFKSVPTELSIVSKLVQEIFKYIDEKLEDVIDVCEKLRLDRIKFVEKAVSARESEAGLYRIVLETLPYGLFEGMIAVTDIKGNLTINLENLARQDLYGAKSLCVESFWTKPFCICNEKGRNDYVVDEMGMKHA